MKTAQGDFQQCYNAQIAVDGDNHLIVAQDLTRNTTDYGSLLPMLEEIEDVNGSVPDLTLADAGYKSEDNFSALQQKAINALVSIGREGKKAGTIVAGKKLTKRMLKKLKTKKGKKLYKRRKAIVEPVFSWIKQSLGFRRFSVRGIQKVAGEWSLVCCAINLKRLCSMMVWVEA